MCSMCAKSLSKKPDKVTFLNKTSKRYYEGCINVYCRHANCCDCEVSFKIMLFSYADRFEASLSISGNRWNFNDCVKSRPVKGIQKQKLYGTVEESKSIFSF